MQFSLSERLCQKETGFFCFFLDQAYFKSTFQKVNAKNGICQGIEDVHMSDSPSEGGATFVSDGTAPNQRLSATGIANKHLGASVFV